MTNGYKLFVIAVAVGLKIWGNKPWSNKELFSEAKNFVDEAVVGWMIC